MFDQLFVRSEVLTRQLSAPLVDERRQYLTHCAVRGMTKSTLEAKARLLLSIAEYLRLAYRPRDTISLSESSEVEIETYRRAAAETSPANQSNRGLLPYPTLRACRPLPTLASWLLELRAGRPSRGVLRVVPTRA